jgi:DNA-binding NarL/FixJ family response regulator
MQVVAEANDGVAAIDATRKWHPDVVVMDINMPRMNGLEATKRIKEAFPDTAVIGLSIQRAGDVERLAREAGMCAYLYKESASSTLCPAIEDAVRTNPSRSPST